MSININGIEKRQVVVSVSEEVVFLNAMMILGLYKYIEKNSKFGYKIVDGNLIMWRENYYSDKDEEKIIKDKKTINEYNLAITLKRMFDNVMMQRKNNKT